MFSDEWSLEREGVKLARAHRYPRQHFSRIALPDGTIWILHPERWGLVQAEEEGVPFARATRVTWSGRRWEIAGVGFSHDLLSHSLLRRRWSLEVGNEPVVDIRGTPFSYNRLDVEAVIPVPLVAVLLAWHVICRAWEASATYQLLPQTGRRPGAVTDPG